jgi:hypothetical protein
MKPVPIIGGKGGGASLFVETIREPNATTLGPTRRITSARLTPLGCLRAYRMSIDKLAASPSPNGGPVCMVGYPEVDLWPHPFKGMLHNRKSIARSKETSFPANTMIHGQRGTEPRLQRPWLSLASHSIGELTSSKRVYPSKLDLPSKFKFHCKLDKPRIVDRTVHNSKGRRL